MPKVTQTYLGDGLYAAYDGYQITLSANGHDREHGATDVVYLEPGMLRSLNAWAAGEFPDYNSGKKFGE